MTLQEYAKVRKMLEDAERRLAQADGASSQQAKQLRGHGCRDFDAAEAKRDELLRKVETLEGKITTGLQELEDKHGEKLG